MGISNEEENKNAYKLVQKEKKEEEMTHGVEISKWRVGDMLFSLWDFAGIINNKFRIQNFFRKNMLIRS